MKRFLRSGLGLFTAMAVIALLASTAIAQTATDPLVQVLVQKGVLTADDAKNINGTPAEQRDRLAQILKQKGVISDSEYATVREATTIPAASPFTVQPIRANAAPAVVVPAVYTSPKPDQAKDAPKPPAPTFIPAVAPVRVLQLDPSKVGGLIPDIKLGSGASLKLYGFFKSSVVYDTSSPYGLDFPLPGFLGTDIGVAGAIPGVDSAGGAPEFHIKARAFRIGGNFEWPDISKHVAITGRIEADFEGDFTRAQNRNVSSIRSSQPSLRLAWGRIDYRPTDTSSYFLLAGQDWSPFGSSILPNMLESTGNGIAFGNLYTREPQVRIGMTHNFGGDRKFTVGPEFAIVLPAFGVTPPFVDTNCPVGSRVTVVNAGTTGPATATICTGNAGSVTLAPGNLADQLGYGERLGVDSAKPGIEGRLVFQFQADKAKGVAPAQIVFSGMHANRSTLVPRSMIAAFAPATSSASFLAAFPAGTSVDSDRWGASGGFSVPTRFVTVTANYYRGTDLRWYFAGQLYPDFVNATGLTSTFVVPSIDGTTNLTFGLRDGVPSVSPVVPVRSQGGFIELGFPLSRIAHAEPTGRNAGLTMNLHYGYDASLARDVRRASPAGGRGKGDVGYINFNYKMNQFVTFALEESYYRTRAFRGTAGQLPAGIFGTPAQQWHDFRSEFSTIFTF